MPGKVLQVLVEAGAEVTRGQPLVIVEAMKMEHTIAAPFDATVRALLVAALDQVDADQPLVELEAIEST
ncbi:MAG: hypothetical protein KC609_13500 [Myxococcales bacterium]|nr:hypothetical protein [Myxococcales bacterium]